MEVEHYDEKTREKITQFLQKKGRAISSELIRLGTDKKVVNWQSFQLILKDLKKEGLVTEERIGSQVKIFTWKGG